MSEPVLKQMTTRAGWKIFDYVAGAIGTAILAVVIVVFRQLFTLHWKESLIIGSIIGVVAVGAFVLVYKVVVNRYEQKLSAQKAEFEAFRTDVYADVILAWLKQCKTRRSFGSTWLAERLKLPHDDVLAAIHFLQNRRLLTEVPGGGWEFKAEDGLLVTPYFCQNPVLQERQEGAHV